MRVSDGFLDIQLALRPSNAHYLSPESQNQCIHTIGSEVLDIIGNSVRKADFLAVIMNETTDLAHLEQVTMAMQYCDENVVAV